MASENAPLEAIPPFVPPHDLADTYWNEWLEGGNQYVKWAFEENQLLLELPGGDERCGTWSVDGEHISAQVPETDRLIAYVGTYRGELTKTIKLLRLEPTGEAVVTGSQPKQLSYAGRAYYPPNGQFSREWFYYWERFVPEEGQADTVQGEVLRVTHWIAARYGNGGRGFWMEHPQTYDAYAEVAMSTLCDGTLDPSAIEHARRTITKLRQCCSNESETEDGPTYSDVDLLPDLALEWCKLHPYPIPRERDPRMGF